MFSWRSKLMIALGVLAGVGILTSIILWLYS